MAGKEQNVLDRMLVRISHLDRLLNLVGEVIITSNNITTVNRRIQDFYDRREPLDKISLDMVKTTQESSNRISSDLHSLVMDIRMVEISGTFQRFRRPVRDMSKNAGKQVELELEGEDTLVDKTIAEKLYDPINHQVRNSIDHGIEDPLERQRAGKPVKGRLKLKAYQRESNIFVEIQDDGRGIDSGLVAKRAVERGIISDDTAESLSEEEKLALIFHPGLSTKTTASAISGRGVGMDVVKSNIEELGGEVTIDSHPGEGSTFTYRIPQVTAVNILDCLTVRAKSNLFAIPILNVVSTLNVDDDAVHMAFSRGKSITYLNSIVTLFDLNLLLGGEALSEAETGTVVIVEGKNGRVALAVSELLTPEKLVYTPLSNIFSVQGVSGVTMMSGSKMGLIVNVKELIDRSKGISSNHDLPAEEELLGAEPETGKVTGAINATATQAGQDDDTKDDAGFADGVKALTSDAGSEISNRDEFFMELEEILNSLGEEILSLETNPGDMELINKAFRNFHSMKGNLMMVGLAELGAFIHKVEAILDRARDGNLEITSEIIDILLDATDVVKSARQALIDGKAPEINESLLKTIEKFQKPKQEKQVELLDVHQRTFQLGALEQFNLLARRHSGHFVYQVFLCFKPEYQRPFLVALLILRQISNIGHVFGAVPSIEEIQNQNVDTQLKIMFSSSMDHDKLKEFIESRLVKFYDVLDFEILKTF